MVGTHERGADEASDGSDDGARCIGIAGNDGGGTAEGEAGGKHRQSAEREAFGVAQEGVAPFDRCPQRPLTLGEALVGGDKQEPVAEKFEDLRRWEGGSPHGGQLDRQRHAFEEAAQLTDRGQLLGILVEGRAGVTRSFEEQLDRGRRCDLLDWDDGLGRREGRQRLDALPDLTDDDARGRQHAHTRTRREQRADHRGDVGDDVLAVVDHDEHLAIAQEGLQEREGVAGTVLVALSEPERGGDMGRHDVAARGGSEVDEPGAVVKVVDESVGDCQSQACLTAPRRAGDRDQAGPFQRLARCDHVVVPADQSCEHGGQVVPRALRSGARWRVEIRVVDQHRLLECPQRRRGFDAQLVGQDAAGVLERTQRLGLAAAPIQRHHELLPSVLTQRFFCDRASQRVDDQIVATQRQLYVRPQFVCPAPQLLEPRYRTAHPHLVGERPPGATPPQGARRLDFTQGPLRLRTREVFGLPYQ